MLELQKRKHFEIDFERRLLYIPKQGAARCYHISIDVLSTLGVHQARSEQRAREFAHAVLDASDAPARGQ